MDELSPSGYSGIVTIPCQLLFQSQGPGKEGAPTNQGLQAEVEAAIRHILIAFGLYSAGLMIALLHIGSKSESASRSVLFCLCCESKHRTQPPTPALGCLIPFFDTDRSRIPLCECHFHSEN